MANIEELTTQPNHGEAIGILENKSVPISPIMQNFIDDLVQKLNMQIFGRAVRLPGYTVATLPAVPDVSEPSQIFVSDETGGSVPAFSDGTNWRRVTDRAIVS